MFKNLIDSFLIIDAKEKPAPSFLMAYIFTWLFFNDEKTLTFFKTTGDLTTRFNASYDATLEYNIWWVGLFTLAVVAIRFVLNNIIYYMREFIDNKTQKRLVEKEHKSFVSNSEYQKLKAQISSLHIALSSAQDKESLAKSVENKATSAMHDLTTDRDKYKGQYETEHQHNEDTKSQLMGYKRQRTSDEITISSTESDLDQVQNRNEALEKSNNEMEEHLGTIKSRLRAWAESTSNEDIKLLGLTRHEENEEVVGKLSQLLNAEVDYSRMGGLIRRANQSNLFGEVELPLQGLRHSTIGNTVKNETTK